MVDTNEAVDLPVDVGERDRRYARVRAEMERDGLDRLLVYAPGWRRDNVRYLTGTAIRSGWCLLDFPLEGEPRAFATARSDLEALGRTGWVTAVDHVADAAALDGLAAGNEAIGLVHLEILPHVMHRGLDRVFKEGGVRSATELMDRVRLVKTDAEIAQMRRCAELAVTGWETFIGALVPGALEYEVVAQVEAEIKRLGAEDNFMIVASGGDDVRGMTPPTDRALQPGDMVRTELTPQLDGYWAQICRSATVGDPSTAQRRSFEIFDEATQAGLDAVRPGATAHDIARAENDVFRAHGLGEFCSSQYTRVRGHGLGLHFDEAPAIVEGNETVLEENAVFIVHPNTFTPIAGYHVLGDPVIVTPGGHAPLLDKPRELVGAAIGTSR